MLQAGVDLSTVGAITGHSDNQLILHYSHATRDSRRKAIEVLENVMNESERKSAPTLPEGVRKMRKAIWIFFQINFDLSHTKLLSLRMCLLSDNGLFVIELFFTVS